MCVCVRARVCVIHACIHIAVNHGFQNTAAPDCAFRGECFESMRITYMHIFQHHPKSKEACSRYAGQCPSNLTCIYARYCSIHTYRAGESTWRSTSAVTVTTVPGLGQASPDAANPAPSCEEAATTEVSCNRGVSRIPAPAPTCEGAATEARRGVACPSGDSKCSVGGRTSGWAGRVLARACVQTGATGSTSSRNEAFWGCASAGAPTSVCVASPAASTRVSGEMHSAERAPTTWGGAGGGAAGVLGE